jgi:nicotinamidase-related amidase
MYLNDRKNKMNTRTILIQIALLSLAFLCHANDTKSKSILLVIDMQKDLLTYGRGGMHMDSSHINSLIQNVNENIKMADSLHIPVAYIQNVWANPIWIYFAGNVCRKGDKETDFDPRLLIVNKTIYEKSVPNSFSNRKLVEYIEENRIENVIICGIKTEACVGATTNNSLRRNYKTFIIAPAIGSNSLTRLTKDIAQLQKSGAIKVDKIDELIPNIYLNSVL